MEKIIYSPSETQRKFHESDKLFRLFGGAAGGGKSKALRMEVFCQCMSAPKVRGLILRRTYKELWGAIIQPMLGEIPKELYKYNQSKNVITFLNIKDDITGEIGQSEVYFGYCRYEKDVYQYQGEEFDFIGIDELTHFTEFQFKYLLSRLRTVKENIVPNFFGTTNPGGVGHVWVKRLWIDREYVKGEKGWEFNFTPSFVYDNKYLVDNDPEYIYRLESLPEKEKKALLHGDWDIFEGQFFKEYNKNLHVVSPYIPKFGRKIICMDYGYSKPSALYWLNKGLDGKITCYRELYVTEHTYKQLATKMKALTGSDENIEAVIVDPAIYAKSGNTENGMSGGEILEGEIRRRVERANNDRLTGWTIVRQALQPYTNINTGLLTSILEICSNCFNLIRTIPQMIHDKIRVEDLDSSGEDHGVDSLRYGLMYLGIEKRSFTELKETNQELKKPKEKKHFEKTEKKDILHITF